MGVIWTSKTRTRQPTVWVPPNAQVRGEMVIAHDSQSLEVRNPQTGGIDGVFTTMSGEPLGPPFVYPDSIGLALSLTHDRAFLTSNIADSDSFSSLVLVKPTTGGLATDRYWLSRGNDSSGAGWSVCFGHNNAAKPILSLILTSGGVAFFSVVGATTLAADVWTAVACVWDARSGVMKIFVNGVLDGTTTPGATTLRSSGVALTLGGLTDSTGGSHYGGRGPLFLTKRVWLNSEVEAYSKNPWQLFAPEKRPLFFSTGGGANTTGTLAVTLDAATLTGVGAVTTSGTLATTLDATTLTGVGNVTRSGTLSVTLDAATLSGTGAVTRSGTLSSTLDDVTLAGVGSVAVGTNRDGTLAVTLDAATLAGIGAVTRSGTLAVTLDAATLAGVGTAGQAVTGTLGVTLGNVTLAGIGAIPAAPSAGGGKTFGSNKKKKKQRKAIESEEWLKAEETAKQLLQDRFTKTTPEAKLEALASHIESLQPVIDALKALATADVQEPVQETRTEELTEHQQVLNKFDALITKMASIEELLIIMMAQ